MRGKIARPYLLLLGLVVGLVLFAVFVYMYMETGEIIPVQVTGIIDALNELVAGSPPWLK